MRKITTMEAAAVLALLAVLPLSLRAVELNEVDVTLLPQLVGRGNGYTEIGFSLTNRSPEVKQVGLTLEAAYNYGRGLNRLSRKVTLPPESSMKVSLWQPPLAMNNPQLTIEVNGRVFTPDKHNLQPGTSGNFGRNTVILLSQQVPGNSGKFYQGPAGSYSGGIEYQMSSMPVAQWSKYALAYSGVPMIMLTGRDWKEMPEEVKNALLQYADLGGVILLIGVEAPERAVLLNEYWRRENVGFGYLLYSSIEPEAFSESDWQYLERDWQRFQNTVNDNAMKNSGNLFRALLSIDSNNFPLSRTSADTGYSSVRPSSARKSVTSSMYSRSPPTGTPLAILVTLMPVGLISLLIYIAVVSPSRLELVAMMTSFTSSVCNLVINSFSLISEGPIPSIGEIAPCSTW